MSKYNHGSVSMSRFNPEQRADYQEKLAAIPKAMHYSLLIIEPGDVLVVSNIGQLTCDQGTGLMDKLMEILPVEQVVLFENDIDLSVLRASTKE